MKNDEQKIAHLVRRNLNQQLDLNSRTLARLELARGEALKHQRVEARTPVLAWATNAIGGESGSGSLVSRMLLPTLVLIVGLFAINQWRESQTATEIEEIDAAILTGELPLDAYLDKGFDAWLKRSSR